MWTPLTECPIASSVRCRGYNMGVRMVDEFCAKFRGAKCKNFRETMETVGRVRGLSSYVAVRVPHLQ